VRAGATGGDGQDALGRDETEGRSSIVLPEEAPYLLRNSTCVSVLSVTGLGVTGRSVTGLGVTGLGVTGLGVTGLSVTAASDLPLGPRRIGIVASNSTGYVEAVLSTLERGDVVVPLSSPDDQRAQSAGVTETLEPRGGASWFSRSHTPGESEELAMVAFTSGTTGKPKGVLLSQRCLGDACRRLIEVMCIDASIREYIGVPVYHSFGFGRCRTVAAAGGQFFLPRRGFNPVECAELLRAGRINALSIVPTLARVLLQNAALFQGVGAALRWCELGSQFMSADEKLALRELFPEAVIVQHYGLTEASRASFLALSSVDAARLDSVGKPAGDTELCIDAAGRIAIRGSLLASGLLVDGQIQPLVAADGWFHTTDNGALEDGWLHFRGRADDVINCGGVKVAPEALEAELCALLELAGGLAVARMPHPLRGEGVLIAVTPQVSRAHSEIQEAARSALQRRGLHVSDALRVVPIDELPCTAAGKVQRHRLSALIGPPSSAVARESAPPAPAERETVRGVFAAALNGQPAKADDTFVSLGGDSLSFVQATVGLERILQRVPPNWENLTIAQLEQLPQARAKSFLVALETGIVIRALAILSVVNTHIGLGMLALGLIGSIPGGTHPLMLLSGLGFARFHGAKTMASRTAQPVFSYLSRILPAYWAITLALLCIYRPAHPAQFLLLYSSFGPDRLFGFWFIEALVHANLLLLGLALLPRVRSAYQAAPFACSLTLAGVATAGALAWQVLAGGDPRNIIGALWLFALGMAMFHAHRRWEQLAALAALGVAALSLMNFSDLVWTLLGAAAIVLLPRIVLPRPVASATTLLAKASLFIYLGHLLCANTATHLFKVSAVEARYLFGVFGGILLYLCNELFWRVVAALRGSRALQREPEAAD
jgi:acyl-CoA synthetase (AMP-forming)/AMP-acid ligase II